MPPAPLAVIPTTDGPTKPPSDPIELINAIPDAAEVPVRNSFGSDQNGPKKPSIPIAASDQRVIESNGESVVPSEIKAMPPTNRGIAAWYRRSNLQSELRETRIIANKPAR